MPCRLCSYLRILIDFLRIGADYWLTIYPRVTAELKRWRRIAEDIPDPTLRAQALAALDDKRRHAEGAAAFAVLSPRAERARVVPMLVAFQVMYDYLDTISEQAGPDPLHDTLQLHTALTDALLPGVARGAAYSLHPHDADGGYLARFIGACRTGCSGLPAFDLVAPLVRSSARLARQSQGYNHALPSAPPRFLAEVIAPWAASEGGRAHGLTWWEVIGAAGSSLAILALIAAAADPTLEQAERDAIYDVYAPWAGAVLALLDSIVDQARDSAEDTHSLSARYPSSDVAADRLSGFVRRAIAQTRNTAQPERHALIVAAMIALFATAPGAKAPEARRAIERALDATGPQGSLSLAALRLRRALKPRFARAGDRQHGSSRSGPAHG